MITVVKAYSIRQSSGSQLLIVGCGNGTLARTRSPGHLPHPEGALTTSLGDGLGGTPDVACNFLDPKAVEMILKAHDGERFDMVHFENLDSPVAADPKAIANAWALLNDQGILLIECGALGIDSLSEEYKKVGIFARPQVTLKYLQTMVTTGGFDLHESNTSISLVAGKNRPASDEESSGISCYVTTATCTSLGLPEDCHQLQLLRHYRDGALWHTPGGKQIIVDYYQHAEDLVAQLEALPGRAEAYRSVYDSIVQPACEAIATGETSEAFRIVRSARKTVLEILRGHRQAQGSHRSTSFRR